MQTVSGEVFRVRKLLCGAGHGDSPLHGDSPCRFPRADLPLTLSLTVKTNTEQIETLLSLLSTL